MSPDALYNGARVEPAEWPRSRGLHYGDGVFRTLYIHEGECIDWPGQRAHLLADAARLGLSLPAAAAQSLDAEVRTIARERTAAVLKILLWRQSSSGRGYAPAAAHAERLLLCSPAPEHPAACWTHGVRVIDSPVRLASPHLLAGAKHLNRLEQVLASREWPAGIDEALMSDADGHVVCGTRSNLFWSHHGQLLTPSVERCGVAGRMRARVLELAARQGLEIAIRLAPRAELEAADELFLTNSVFGIWPVRRYGAHDLQAPGPLTQALMRQLHHPRMP